jgi:hypothetical protein
VIENVRSKVIRAAVAMHNVCLKVYKANQCKECPFSVGSHVQGCDLYQHPINWEGRIKKAKRCKQ